MNNNDALQTLMAEHALTRAHVAALSGYAVASVDRWLRPADNPRYLRMPDRALDLLRYRLDATEV